MTDEQLAYSIDRIKEYGIAVSGDAETQGIGAMTDDRWQSFFETMVEQGIFKPETDYTQAYTLQFVNKGVDAYRTWRRWWEISVGDAPVGNVKC